MNVIKPYYGSETIPFTHEQFELSYDGKIFDCAGSEIGIEEFNSRTGLDVENIHVLLAVTYQKFNCPPAYWSKLNVLYMVEDVYSPETLVIGLKEPLESLEFPGFYIIPYFSNYVISPEGTLIKKSNGRVMQASRGPLGYYTFRMTDDSGKTQNRLRHRILCYAFKPYPANVEKLDVNHINGQPGTDDLDNLEWSTRSENVDHAYSMGLRNDNLEVQARDVETGRVYIFASCSQAARFFETSHVTIGNRAKSLGYKAYNGYQFRYHPNNDPWPATTESDGKYLVEFPDGRKKKCGCVEAAKLAGLTRTSLLRMLREGRNYGKTPNRITRLTS